MNLPNRITLSRIFLAFIFLIFFYMPQLYARPIAFFIYVLAILSDIYDGYLARKTGVITGFGKFFDPLADKILVTIIFLVLIESGYLKAWIIALILVREFLITGMRTLAAYKGIAIQASRLGKLKTIFQMSLTTWALVVCLFPNLMLYWIPLNYQMGIIDFLAYTSLLLTYLSGYDYIVKSKKIFAGDI